MKIKTILLLIISAALLLSFSLCTFATEYVFDENGVVISEGGNSSIGIIGGADGPTAIFVSGGSSLFLFAALAIAAVSLVIIIIVTLKRRRKNK